MTFAPPRPPPAPVADDALRPPTDAAGPGTAEPAATGLPDEPPTVVVVTVRDAQLDSACVRVRWLPSTEIFEFTIDETTTTLALKMWLSARVGCAAPHMHIDYGITQLPDEVLLS